MAEFVMPRNLPAIPGRVRIVCTGDTYGTSLGDLPCGDIFIHTGNFSTPSGNAAAFISRIIDLPHEYKIIICGKVENLITKSLANCINGSLICIDGATTQVHGLRIASATQISSEGIKVIPLYCNNDIVVSHIPPWGILDKDEKSHHVGSRQLLNDLKSFPPKVCIFGGNPSGHGAMNYKGIICINAGQRGSDGQQYGVPLVVDVCPGGI